VHGIGRTGADFFQTVRIVMSNNNEGVAWRLRALISSVALRALILYGVVTPSPSAMTLSRIVEANGLAVLSVTLRSASTVRLAMLKPSAATTARLAPHPWL
jgi:hypothetical protein